MFGVYRTLLALGVLFQHLAEVPLVGHFAVYGFFVLSGYLMTAIMHETYGYSLRGRMAYGINRFLRLFPLYWMICLFTIALILVFGETLTRAYHSEIYLPREGGDILANLSLIFPHMSPKWASPRLAPPTWALTLELTYYVLIGLGVSRSRRLTVLWLGAGLAYYAASFALGLGHETRYSYLPAASLPFSIGALLFHYRDATAAIARWLPGHPFALLPLYVLLALLAEGGGATLEVLFAANIALHAVIIVKLRDLRGGAWLQRFDKPIGDLSYPIYLGHYECGFVVSMALWCDPIIGASPRGIVTALLAALLALVLAQLVHRFLERPIAIVREAVKRSPRLAPQHDSA